MKQGLLAALAAVAIALAAAGCSHHPKATASIAPGEPASGNSTPSVLEAIIAPTQGNDCSGVVRFERQGDGSVKVTAELKGLAPNTTHGFHVHETGDCSAPDAMSAGGHYNPAQSAHGLPPGEPRHAGDLGNVTSDADGRAHLEITTTDLTLGPSGNSVMGRAVIVHAKPDDGGQPTGNAGARVGCGVIGVPPDGKR